MGGHPRSAKIVKVESGGPLTISLSLGLGTRTTPERGATASEHPRPARIRVTLQTWNLEVCHSFRGEDSCGGDLLQTIFALLPHAARAQLRHDLRFCDIGADNRRIHQLRSLEPLYSSLQFWPAVPARTFEPRKARQHETKPLTPRGMIAGLGVLHYRKDRKARPGRR